MAENRETVFPGFEIRDGVLKEYTGAGGIVRVPDGVLTIEKNVFSNREDISSVVLPEGLQIIRDNLFSGCTGLREVRLPGSVRTVCRNAFRSGNARSATARAWPGRTWGRTFGSLRRAPSCAVRT